MSKGKKIKELESLVYNLELELKKTKQTLGELSGRSSKDSVDYSLKAAEVGSQSDEEEGMIIEGVFNGQMMIGPDGKQYTIPANYASKSKLVEGDILKLSIDRSGNFVYKQISPVNRKRLVGHLVRDNTSGEFVALVGDKVYKILLASITYFKGEEGDEVVVLVPQDADSTWAAVENIIKANYSNKKTDNKISQEDLEIEL